MPAKQGCTVLLLTVDTLQEADWPREAIDEFFYIPRDIARDDLLKGVSHLARTRALDRIVALDDFDVETAALLREHLRIPGMGETTARYFRDKLAMRVRARNAGHPRARLRARGERRRDSPLRRSRARRRGCSSRARRPRRSGSSGSNAVEELWRGRSRSSAIAASFYVLERFVPGDVFHVDSIVWEREPICSRRASIREAAVQRGARGRHLHHAHRRARSALGVEAARGDSIARC